MTTKEAIWVVKQTSLGNKVPMEFDYQDTKISCTNITSEDFNSDCKFDSEHGFKNPWQGIYVDVDKRGSVAYGMCVKDKNSNCIYSCNINKLELIRNE